jgi:T5orf172 domain
MKVGEPGYIYVLINPSMEGLVKVGKTTRNPQDRVEELSSSTGVPTPFILVYQEYFEDCSKAELMIHQILESKNARISKNREFFKAQPYEVIKIIQNLKYNHLNTEQLIFDDHVESEEIIENSLAEDLFQQGLKHYFGKENFIQYYQEALLCIKKAAKIGHADLHRYLGIMYWLGHGCKKNLKTTLDYFKKGANLENITVML